MAILGTVSKKEITTGGGVDIEEIRSRLDLQTVATSRLGYNLKRRGNKWQGGHSPVHTSKNEQCLTVYSNQSEGWYCFHCGRGGDVLSLVGVHEFGEGYSGKGQEFRRVLEICAGWAGVELRPLTPEVQAKIEEKERIFACLTEACRWWHEQLIEEYSDNILVWACENYGFSEDFLTSKLIGFAPPTDKGKFLFKHLTRKGFSEQEIYGAAVVRKDGSSRFYGRLIMPYWSGGQVRYLAARQTKLTPDNDYERGKYQKLKCQDADNPQISPYIVNDWFLGLDTLKTARRTGRVLITEGAPDQLAVEMCGEAALSPVTVRFKHSDIPRIAQLVREIPRVYLAMDNEQSEAGLLGALDTAQALERQGVAVQLVYIPREAGREKVDVCDFIKERGGKAFFELYESASRLPHYYAEYCVDYATAQSRPAKANEVVVKLAEYAALCSYSQIECEDLIKAVAKRLRIGAAIVRKSFFQAKELSGQNGNGTNHFNGGVKMVGSDTEEETAEMIPIPGFLIERFEKINSAPPIYQLYLQNHPDTPIVFTAGELLDFLTFKTKIAEITDEIVNHPKPIRKGMTRTDAWDCAVRWLLSQVIIVQAPEDASLVNLIRQRIEDFIQSEERQETENPDAILRGKVFVDEKGWHWFRGADPLLQYLKHWFEKPPQTQDIWRIFRDMGGDSRQKKIKGRNTRCWIFPPIEANSSE